MTATPPLMHVGAAEVDITPRRPLFLYGYPHVQRVSTGVHDPLFVSAMALGSQQPVVILAADLLGFNKQQVARVRQAIAAARSIEPDHIMVTTTHTHSGPVTFKYASMLADPVLPDPDPAYMEQVEKALVQAAVTALDNARPAVLTHGVADGSCTGTNRRDPQGPGDPQVPLWLARDARDNTPIGLLMICAMHPTVLHEDSTLVSADFPGMTRRFLRRHLLGEGVPLLHVAGVCGNLSPRHVVRENTFAQATRIGETLGRSVLDALERAQAVYAVEPQVAVRQIDLPRRAMPSLEQAAALEAAARERYEQLRRDGAALAQVRTAECDHFGAQETLVLARLQEERRLSQFAAASMPAEIQMVRLGQHRIVAWPGEAFVEFALAIKEAHRDVYLVSLANGDLQGYLVTQQAVDEKAYEAGNSVFASPASGDLLVAATDQMLRETAPT